MSKIPICSIPIIVVLLTVGALADCDIDGSWEDDNYNAGETMKFVGDISPSSGFVRGYIENSLGDEVAILPITQIDDDFELTLQTNSSYLNGTYKAHVFYDSFANGSTCGKSVVSSTRFFSNNSDTTIDLWINLTQTYQKTTFEYSGAPVETPLGIINSVIKGTGVAGIPPSLRIQGTQLVSGDGIGDIDIQLSMCQTNEEIMTAYKQVSTFLNSSFTDVVQYERAITELQNDVNMKEMLLQNVTGEREKTNEEVKDWMRVAGGKVDWSIAFFVFFPLGMFGLIVIQEYADRTRRSRHKKPIPLQRPRL